MKELGTALDIPIHVYGPETHMTAIVGMAMGKREIVDPAEMMASESSSGQNFSLPTMVGYKLFISNIGILFVNFLFDFVTVICFYNHAA